MQANTSLSPDQIYDALLASGHSEEEARATAGLLAQAKYEPKRIALRPTFEILSDTEVSFGNRKHFLRHMNVHDKKRALPVLVQVAAHFAREGTEFDTAEKFLQQGPQGVFQTLFAELQKLHGNDEYPEWAVALLQEVAHITSTEAQTVIAGDIISLPSHQFIDLFKKLWAVNQQDFLLLWAEVPLKIRAGIHLRLFTPASRVISTLKRALFREETPSSNGGASSTGRPSSTSPSKSRKTSPTAKSKS